MVKQFWVIIDYAGEAERIRKRNGRVLALESEPHILRVWLPNENAPGLAMSRSFGDFVLKSYGVIATPQVSMHQITSGDQFLLLASDGVRSIYLMFKAQPIKAFVNYLSKWMQIIPKPIAKPKFEKTGLDE